MTQTVDVAVIGGGIAGCAAAYYLTREGLDVAVIEHQGVGNAASGYALGLLNPLSGALIPGRLAAFAREAFDEHLRLWPQLEEQSSIDFQGRMMPHLEVLLDEADVPPLQEEMERWNAAEGFSARWLDGQDVHALDDRIADDVVGAVLLERLGMVDSQQLTRALMDAACQRGASIVHDRAIGITWSGDRALGVRTAGGEVACHAVVIATGPWSGAVEEWTGLRIPVTPLKGQIVRLEGLSPPLEYHVAGPGAVVQKADGKLWAAATEEEAGFDLSTTSQARQDLIERAARVLPSVTQARILEQTACLRPRTPDGLPILGKVPSRKNVYLATGGGKKGVLLAPAMGRVLADLIVRRETGIPIDEFAPGRFAGLK
ncbi:MAG: FAD-dependent oxidoreductase [Dehalococcoidia bacterium]|nr:FAD-dependent oxidoreductase [Dehalococcoidia bacterium]